MRLLCTILLLQFGVLCTASAQNYYYVYGKMDPDLKNELSTLIQNWSLAFGMQNVTVAVMKCYLPRSIQGTAEYNEVALLNRKMILIRLNTNLTPYQQLEVLAHEMVHAQQLYAGDLIRHDRTTFSWKGKKYHNIEQTQHHRRPWEVEAITQSKMLLVSTL